MYYSLIKETGLLITAQSNCFSRKEELDSHTHTHTHTHTLTPILIWICVSSVSSQSSILISVHLYWAKCEISACLLSYTSTSPALSSHVLQSPSLICWHGIVGVWPLHVKANIQDFWCWGNNLSTFKSEHIILRAFRADEDNCQPLISIIWQ